MASSVAFRALRLNISACGVFGDFCDVRTVVYFSNIDIVSLYSSDELNYLENIELAAMALLDLLSFVRNLDSINLCRGCLGKLSVPIIDS